MPAKTSKSSFMDKVRQAHESHKADETKVGGGGDLPPTIENGIAKLVDCHIGLVKDGDLKGEPFFYAAGIVVYPTMADMASMDPTTKKLVRKGQMKVEGLRTQITEMLCDTPGRTRETVDDHYAWVLNQLRLLGIDTAEVSPDDVVAEDGKGGFTSGPVLEALCSEDNPTFFKFRTWMGKPTDAFPNPRTNHDWRGKCEYTPDGDVAAEATQDDTATEAPWEGDDKKEPTPVSPTKAATPKTASKATGKPPAKPPAAPTKAAEPEEDDLLALGKLADGKKKNPEAEQKLIGHAKLFNIDYESADNWTAVAQAIIEASSANPAGVEEETTGETEQTEATEEAEVEQTDEPQEFLPDKGQMCRYTPKGAKEPDECEVLSVFEKAKKVNLQGSDGKTVHKAVPWDDVDWS